MVKTPGFGHRWGIAENYCVNLGRLWYPFRYGTKMLYRNKGKKGEEKMKKKIRSGIKGLTVMVVGMILSCCAIVCQPAFGSNTSSDSRYCDLTKEEIMCVGSVNGLSHVGVVENKPNERLCMDYTNFGGEGELEIITSTEGLGYKKDLAIQSYGVIPMENASRYSISVSRLALVEYKVYHEPCRVLTY
ncbi:MAG: hypothetical protein F6J99_37920 [Moorea sp. SIO4G3]|nr:hypothetical protein [Moorena sp. SIO4G3]